MDAEGTVYHNVARLQPCALTVGQLREVSVYMCGEYLIVEVVDRHGGFDRQAAVECGIAAVHGITLLLSIIADCADSVKINIKIVQLSERNMLTPNRKNVVY